MRVLTATLLLAAYLRACAVAVAPYEASETAVPDAASVADCAAAPRGARP